MLLAVGVRAYVLVQTQGFIDGDEALVGIQAQHILAGEHPVYYYGQPYMGSLEAYLIAALFSIVGSSAWAMRTIPVLLSLCLVLLTRNCAEALADEAQLTPLARRWFTTSAALCSAFPPLYDLVLELRTWGGHIEIYVTMLWLLWCTLRLTQRWQAGTRQLELIGRWAGIGLLIGLGFWIYPLIISAVLAAGIWLLVHAFTINRFKHIYLSCIALPAALVGFLPGLIWGSRHHWANVIFLLSPGNNDIHNAALARYPNRLDLAARTTHYYVSCVAPRILGGATPHEGTASLWNSPFTPGLLLTLVSLFGALAAILLSSFLQRQALTRIKRLAGFPLLFAVCTAVVFCGSSIASAGLLHPCTRDEVGRYAAPLFLVLPFFIATLVVTVRTSWRHCAFSRRRSWREQCLFVFIVLYLCLQSYTYVRADPKYLFQSFACASAPVNTDELIAYMQREHIHSAWASMWIGNALVFKTHGALAISDPRIIIAGAVDHLPSSTALVRHDRESSVLFFVSHTEHHPRLLSELDRHAVTYRLARFPALAGLDVLVVTPVNHRFFPLQHYDLGVHNYSC